MTDEQLEQAIEVLQAMLEQQAKVIEGTTETIALPAPEVIPDTSLNLRVTDAADTAVGPIARARKRKCHRHPARDLRVARCGDGRRATGQYRPRANVRMVIGSPDDWARARRATALHCTEYVFYLPSQPQWRGISYAESKTECQPTKHCKLYSSEIPDRPRDRKAHGPCPQAQPLRTSRRDHDPGRLPSWTAGLGGLRSPMAPSRARPGPHACPRAKNGTPSVHPIRGDEIRALRKLRRENPNEAYVFVTERGGPMSTIGFHHLIQRLGKAAKMPFSLHPHMLRHACGYKLANDGHDTRALQHYLGHKNIQHTVRYTELSPDRFRNFWRD